MANITVVFYNGYEVLAVCGTPMNENIDFNEFTIDLGDGYDMTALYGAETGLKSWSFGFKSLSGSSADLFVQLGNESLNAAEYLWDLFCRSKASGLPFIIKSPRNDQYYLAKFADSRLSYERILTKLFNSTVNFVQKRIGGVSVYNTTLMARPHLHYPFETINGLGGVWNDVTFTKSFTFFGGSNSQTFDGIDDFISTSIP